MTLPLTHWRLHAASLPDRLLDDAPTPSFSLPGADALDAFADLLGTDAGNEPAGEKRDEAFAPFALPGMIDEDIQDDVALSREIDFGALHGDRALLTLDHIVGSGDILLDKETVASFGGDPIETSAVAHVMTASPCMLCVDLTDALHLGRRQTLTLRFSRQRPAGIPGPIFLHTSSHAFLSCISLSPDAHRRSISLRARAQAHRNGAYLLRAQAIPARPGAQAEPARETGLELRQGEPQEVKLCLEMRADAFVPGKPYAAPAIKIQLLLKPDRGGPILCDEALLLCGYPGKAPRAFLALDRADCSGDPDALIGFLRSLNLSCVSFPALPVDRMMRALCRAGISVLLPDNEAVRPLSSRYPNAAFGCEVPKALLPEAAAWQLCGSIAFPRILDHTLTAQDMLLDAAGRHIDAQDARIRDVLAWLRAVQIRLHAEAARQQRYAGALCTAQEAKQPDIADALRTAFAPVHLSALPLCGAWWTGTGKARLYRGYRGAAARSSLRADAALRIAARRRHARAEHPAYICRRARPARGSIYVMIHKKAASGRPRVRTTLQS